MRKPDNDNATPLPVLRTPEEVAAWLGISRKSLYIMVDRGQIPPSAVIKIGARMRFDESRLKEWIAEKRAPTRGVPGGL
jgi:excisionase family DNA binding protein